MSSAWGEHVKISLFGESRGPAVGVVLEGLPAGEEVDEEGLKAFLRRRAPGFSELSSPRREADEPRILSGVYRGHTTGAPLAILLENRDAADHGDESRLRVPRPGHADLPAQRKYGGWQDPRGGGHFSGRLTAPLCAAGGVCLQLLQRRGVELGAHLLSVGKVEDERFDPVTLCAQTLVQLKASPLPVLSAVRGEQMRRAILDAAAAGDSLGGVVECAALGLPVGLGGPLFGGLESRIGALVFAVPAVKGLEFGAGFRAATLRGSEHNDPYTVKNGAVAAETNHAGGVLGGMSTGLPLVFRAAFKPTPSIAREQKSVDLQRMAETPLRIEGRNDPCIAVRAVPVLEAAAALALLDAMLEG